MEQIEYDQLPPEVKAAFNNLENAPQDDMRPSTPDLNQKSSEVDELLGKPPKWIIRSGLSMVFVVVAVFFFGTVFIRYPETLTTEVTLATDDLPASIMAKKTGRLMQIFVNENDLVSVGSVLGVLENTGHYSNIKQVEKWFRQTLNTIREGSENECRPYGERKPKMGQLQGEFDKLQLAIKTHHFNTNVNAQVIRERELNQELAEARLELDMAMKGLTTVQSSLKLAKEKTSSDSVLHVRGIKSLIELKSSQQSLISEYRQVQSAQEEIVRSRSKIDRLRLQLMGNTERDQIAEFQSAAQLRNAATAFERELDNWLELHELTSPINGKVSFYKFWSENQSVTVGDEVMVVTPRSDKIYAYCHVPALNSGKIKPGQIVNIELADFPHFEFGKIKGVITSKSSIAREGKYLVRVDLPDGLMSQYEYPVSFSQGMTGKAHIITEDLALFTRLTKTIRRSLNGLQA